VPQTRLSASSRALVALSIAFGLSYIVILGLSWPFALTTVWKGAGVALLAIAAALEARGRDGWLLALVLALGAFGDVLLETAGLIVGAVAFIAAHIAAILLYLSNRRPAMTGSQLTLVLLVVPLGAFIAWSLPADRAQAPGVAIYAMFVAAMAGAAWASRFPRLRTGLGANDVPPVRPADIRPNGRARRRCLGRPGDLAALLSRATPDLFGRDTNAAEHDSGLTGATPIFMRQAGDSRIDAARRFDSDVRLTRPS
jgi:uncharacterized membrane protein YhhN